MESVAGKQGKIASFSETVAELVEALVEARQTYKLSIKLMLRQAQQPFCANSIQHMRLPWAGKLNSLEKYSDNNSALLAMGGTEAE